MCIKKTKNLISCGWPIGLFFRFLLHHEKIKLTLNKYSKILFFFLISTSYRIGGLKLKKWYARVKNSIYFLKKSV